jgi:hypothetical protein
MLKVNLKTNWVIRKLFALTPFVKVPLSSAVPVFLQRVLQHFVGGVDRDFRKNEKYILENLRD